MVGFNPFAARNIDESRLQSEAEVRVYRPRWQFAYPDSTDWHLLTPRQKHRRRREIRQERVRNAKHAYLMGYIK